LRIALFLKAGSPILNRGYYTTANLSLFSSFNFPTPAANIATSICRFVNCIISITFSVEIAAALRKAQHRLLADDFGDFIENRKYVDWRARRDFVRFAIMDMMREIFEFGEV
jgi:hypothetical protein